MANEAAYFIKLASWLTRVLGEGSSFLSELDAYAIGAPMLEAIIDDPDVRSAGQAATSAGEALSAASEKLELAAESGDTGQLVSAIADSVEAIIQFYPAIENLVNEIETRIDSTTIPDAAERALAQSIVAGLTLRISDYIIVSFLLDNYSGLSLLLQLFGLIEWVRVPTDPANPLGRTYTKKSLRLDRIKNLISDPRQHMIDSIGWGSEDFDPTVFFLIMEGFYDEEADVDFGIVDGDPYMRIGFFRIRRDSSQTPPGLKMEISASLEKAFTDRIDLTERWGATIDTSLTFGGMLSAAISPPLTASFSAERGDVSGEFRISLDRNESARPFDIVGGTGILSLSANNATAGVALKAEWDAIDGEANVNPLFFADIDGLTLKIGTSDADSFIGKILADAEIEGNFDLGLEWQGDTGLRVKASGGVEIALPIHKKLGPIEFQTLYLVLKIKPDGTLSFEISSALAANLGPLSASVDRMGALLDMRFTEGTDAKFGPFDLDLGFKPPNGIGLSIDAGVVKGGGYLYIDAEKGEYAGALELIVSEVIALKAIGLIATKMPDGSDGFSLIVIITAEFGAGIQLGYGFVLIGVGGLLGLNRTMLLEPLMEGVRTGAVSRIMFPTNVIENASRIISDLQTIFPAEEGKFLIGPMCKIGWGTPIPLITISLGIIIEIPGNIAIIGVLRMALPEGPTPILVLQVNFAGAIEFDKSRAFFFAAVFESRILTMTIEGEMGVLVCWGEDANFVVSVGGFHPSFDPPPLPFPSPVRVAISILNEPNARIRVDGYFALTTNTVQFGAHAELYFKFNAFKVEGHLGFDALMRFSPFYFIITVSASMSLKAFGVGVFSVRLRFALEGPTPWRAKGTGSISMLFFSISANFDKTWGERKDTILPPVSVMPILKAEFEKFENWTASVPSSNKLLVTLRELETDHTTVVLHPVGTLNVSQRVVPLDLDIDKLGNQKPNDANRFSLTVTTSGLGKKSDKLEKYAMAQFKDYTDTQKLSLRPFEQKTGGLELSAQGRQTVTSRVIKRIVRYESIIIDSNYKRFVQRFYVIVGSIFGHFLKGNAVTRSALSNKRKLQMQPFGEKVQITQEGFTVVSNVDNRPINAEAAQFVSQTSALEYMEQQVIANPGLAGSLQVIPQSEVNMAA